MEALRSREIAVSEPISAALLEGREDHMRVVDVPELADLQRRIAEAAQARHRMESELALRIEHVLPCSLRNQRPHKDGVWRGGVTHRQRTRGFGDCRNDFACHAFVDNDPTRGGAALSGADKRATYALDDGLAQVHALADAQFDEVDEDDGVPHDDARAGPRFAFFFR